MAMNYGNNVAKSVHQARKNIQTTAWTALSVGSTPKEGRYAVRIFVKGNTGHTLALTYANVEADGTFTAPTTLAKDCTIYPGGRTWIEPLSDKVAVYGKLVDKGGETENSIPVIITEYC